MEYPVLKPGSTWFNSATKTRPDFTTIRVVDRYTPTGNEAESWAADTGELGDITCYVVGTELIIAGNGSGMISANEDSSFAFSVDGVTATNVQTFKNVTHFYGAELLDMSNVITLKRAFAYMMSLESINVSKWNFSKLESLEYTFGAANSVENGTGHMSVKRLDVSNWNISNVTTLYNAFLQCRELELLDTRHWNVSKVTTIRGMCHGCKKLKAIYTENWDTPNLSDMRTAFNSCSSLKELNLKKLNNQGVSAANKAAAITGLNSLEKLTLGSNYTITNTNGSPDNPLSEYIEGADGKWHTLRGDSFDADNLPSGINITYYASPLLVEKVLATPVILPGVTALDIANAVREKTGTMDDVPPSEVAAAIRSIESGGVTNGQ